MLLYHIFRNLIIINLFLLHDLTISAEIPFTNSKKKAQSLDPCAENVIQSYHIGSPNFLCSDPNTNGFMFSIEGQGVSAGYYKIKANTTPLLVEYKDGTFHLEIEVNMNSDSTKEYLIQMEGNTKSIDSPQLGLTAAQNYCSSKNTTGWIFYNRFTLKLTGKNANSGQVHVFESPQSNGHTFQIGKGANTWQSTLGSGLWFDNANINNGTATIKGDLQISLTSYKCCNQSICVPYTVMKND